MKRKHLYVAGAAIAGALLVWWWRRPSSRSSSATVALGDTFTVNGNTYSTPQDLRTPENVVMIN